MATKQTIAIIGATGSMGSAIAKKLATESYRLVLMAKNAEELQKLQSTILTNSYAAEVETLVCQQEACWEADLIIFAISHLEEIEIAPTISQYVTGKVVISMADSGTTNELQLLLPHSKVIHVFNHDASSAFSDTAPKQNQLLIGISGNDDEAVETVAHIVKNAGLPLIITENPL